MKTIHHALVLNLHQPAGNLEDLLDHYPWDAKQILYALDRIPRSLLSYQDIARVHLSLSGTLLETLASPSFQERVYGIVDCGSLLWQLQNTIIFNILGTGYYHPVLPLIPEADRKEHLQRWRGIAEHLFWRKNFEGFWPPEMGFSMELIPLLKQMGYQYVLVDSLHVEAITPMSWQALRYRPHIAKFGGEEIVVVVRDRELSDAQESGMDYAWFDGEVRARTQGCDFLPLVVTCTDGDNGGWFRNTNEGCNFWTAFYFDLLNAARADRGAIQPCYIHDYINKYGVFGEVVVNTGAWNTGWHHGVDFIQWTGSQLQKDALSRVAEVSKNVHDARWFAGQQPLNAEREEQLEKALWHLLRAETSCNFYWGEDWVHRCHQDLDAAAHHLHETASEIYKETEV
ncbi:MAG: glycoside hydrolase family 57 [Gammaproteobacteria bacterium]